MILTTDLPKPILHMLCNECPKAVEKAFLCTKCDCKCDEEKGIWCIPCLRESLGLPPQKLPKPKKKSTFVKSPHDHIKYNSHLIKPGMRFGKLTTIRNAQYPKNGRVRWSCLCDCGKEVRVSRIDLLENITTECRDCRIALKQEKYR